VSGRADGVYRTVCPDFSQARPVSLALLVRHDLQGRHQDLNIALIRRSAAYFVRYRDAVKIKKFGGGLVRQTHFFQQFFQVGSFHARKAKRRPLC